MEDVSSFNYTLGTTSKKGQSAVIVWKKKLNKIKWAEVVFFWTINDRLKSKIHRDAIPPPLRYLCVARNKSTYIM